MIHRLIHRFQQNLEQGNLMGGTRDHMALHRCQGRDIHGRIVKAASTSGYGNVSCWHRLIFFCRVLAIPFLCGEKGSRLLESLICTCLRCCSSLIDPLKRPSERFHSVLVHITSNCDIDIQTINREEVGFFFSFPTLKLVLEPWA